MALIHFSSRMKIEENSIRLCWDQFQTNVPRAFENVRSSTDFSDVTLIAEDDSPIEAHRVILAAGSKFFQNILSASSTKRHPHPLIYLRGVGGDDLNSLLDFLYTGKTCIEQRKLGYFLELAKQFGMKGLDEEEESENIETEQENLKEDQTIIKPIEGDKIEMTPKRFSEGQNLQKIKHEMIETESEQSQSGSNLMTDKVKEDMMHFIDEKFQCKVCDIIYDEETKMIGHIESHLEAYQSQQIDAKKSISNIEDDFKTKPCLEKKTLGHKKPSPVWNFAKLIEGLTVCSFCNKKYEYMKANQNTSNMMRHIKKHHNAELRIYLEKEGLLSFGLDL